MTITGLYWREPLFLLLALLPLLALALNRWWQHRSWQRFADAGLIPWLQAKTGTKPQRLALLSLLTGWLLLCIALAGPRSVDWLPPDQQPDPAMLVVVMDLSASMNALDVHPDRRSLAQQQLIRWLEQKPAALAVGLVVYAGHAFQLMPASTDSAVISHFAQSLADIRLPTAGNDLPAALDMARQQLLAGKGERRLLVLTDGDIESAQQNRVEKSLREAWTGDHIQTQIIGIGESKAVTLPDAVNGLLKQDGRPVLTRLQSAWLQQLGDIPSVRYQHYRLAAQQTLAQLLQLSQPRIDATAQQNVIWHEWFALALLPGMLLIGASVWLQSRRVVHGSAGILLLLLMISGLPMALSTPLYAADEDALETARRALDSEDFQLARELFSQIDSLQANFSEGIACYRLKDFDCARLAFTRAAWRAQTDSQRARAVFNLANSYFFLGDYDQAAVLYRDAELLGLDADICALNLSYATSLQAALQRHIRDIRETLRRAQWRAAAAGVLAPSLKDLITNERNLLRPDSAQDTPAGVFHPFQQVLQQQLEKLLGLSETSESVDDRKWVKTEQVLPQTTAAMLNRLFQMELGITANLKQPQIVEGKRKW